MGELIYAIAILAVLVGLVIARLTRDPQKERREEKREKALSELDQLALLRRQGRVTDEDYEKIQDMIVAEGGGEANLFPAEVTPSDEPEKLAWEETDPELFDDLTPEDPDETHDHIPSTALDKEQRLEQLKAWKEAGLVDDEEYRQRRREILEE